MSLQLLAVFLEDSKIFSRWGRLGAEYVVEGGALRLEIGLHESAVRAGLV
jgi:hypothetical protein